ncbi:hypothetical protein E2C01_101759 [Portunus trituberculatus]|uniref:Uncharacterized protein n=1 Tax=Portunus trituberculatus TaxID=210409 RepID=A0A5B7KGN9_PORTR|nr:hypothetical protein [Portunus trituberculatus]
MYYCNCTTPTPHYTTTPHHACPPSLQCDYKKRKVLTTRLNAHTSKPHTHTTTITTTTAMPTPQLPCLYQCQVPPPVLT